MQPRNGIGRERGCSLALLERPRWPRMRVSEEQRVCLVNLLVLKLLSQTCLVCSYPNMCLYLHTFYILYIGSMFYTLYLHAFIYLFIFIPFPVDLNLLACWCCLVLLCSVFFCAALHEAMHMELGSIAGRGIGAKRNHRRFLGAAWLAGKHSLPLFWWLVCCH